ncbi:hypothetical protein Mth01_42480 [Sphaerimonospora thailandensis]|uniref:Uncharacterized protein n=1 Tax=Sphaerimonospora thailandensis TaxID=795644 RepID=A0A8J3RBX4_9ACTN|nr:hypothetical protein Mth01_42480 [Sphaerimonospora thailandensis]
MAVHMTPHITASGPAAIVRIDTGGMKIRIGVRQPESCRSETALFGSVPSDRLEWVEGAARQWRAQHLRQFSRRRARDTASKTSPVILILRAEPKRRPVSPRS